MFLLEKKSLSFLYLFNDHMSFVLKIEIYFACCLRFAVSTLNKFRTNLENCLSKKNTMSLFNAHNTIKKLRLKFKWHYILIYIRLLRALQNSNKKYNGSVPKLTDGIEIKEWVVPVEQDGEQFEIRYSCWDFAGQTVYYNTHQVGFFYHDNGASHFNTLSSTNYWN